MRILWITILAAITGCTGVGLVATSDPFEKLSQANSLMSQQRYALAKDVTNQALSIFKNNNNELGIADAYYTYGNIYKQSPEKDYDKSIMYYKQAIVLFEKNHETTGVSKSFVGIGNVYGIKGNSTKECTNYTKALNHYDSGNIKETDSREPLIYDKRYKNLGELINAYIKGYCQS